MTKKHLIFIGLLVTGLTICVTIWVGKNRSEAKHMTKAPVVRPVPTAMVRALSKTYVRRFPGKVRASRRVELAFSVPGLLEQLNAQEGQKIKKGAVLAKLDQRDYQHALDAAKAKCFHAKRELTRFCALREQKVVTEVQYENTKTAYDVALAEWRIREKALADTVLLAPFDGVIARRHVENHEHVQAKQAILSFQDISLFEVVIQVPERLISQNEIQKMAEFQVGFETDPGTERWFAAAVREFSAESDSITRTYDVIIALPPPPGLHVLPGMTARVEARMENSSGRSRDAEHATRAPVEALWHGSDGRSYVWIVDPAGGHPAKKQVEVAAIWGNMVEIRSGLKPGEQVAIAGLHMLRESLRVRPMLAGKEGLD